MMVLSLRDTMFDMAAAHVRSHAAFCVSSNKRFVKQVFSKIYREERGEVAAAFHAQELSAALSG